MAQPKLKFSVAVRTDAYQKLINETLGDKELARQFVADISTVVSGNYKLQTCDAGSVLSAGLVAQSLKLPLTQSLGFAYVIPYGTQAQFQIGYKGLIQLAQRSGQFKSIGARPVHEGEYVGQDKHGEDIFKFDHKYDLEPVVGYYAYFELINGFEKSVYWTKEQCEAHAKRYSKSYGNGSDTDNWTKMFDQMAIKTVLKNLLSKYAPLSTEMISAVKYDQAVIHEDGSAEYVDNEVTEEETSSSVDNSLGDNKE